MCSRPTWNSETNRFDLPSDRDNVALYTLARTLVGHINGNPLRGNTYRRLHDGDRHCDDDTVRRMIAEQMNDVRDLHILHGFSLTDLDPESLHAYRNMLSSHKPDHPWTTIDDLSLLRALGGWRRERSSDEEAADRTRASESQSISWSGRQIRTCDIYLPNALGRSRRHSHRRPPSLTSPKRKLSIW